MPRLKIVRVGPPMFKSTPQFLRDLERELMNNLDLVRRRHLARRQLITMTWAGAKPSFAGDIMRHPSGVTLVVRLRGGLIRGDPDNGNNKWIWVNDGTNVRYATMTKDFVAKTARGRFRSGPGRGGKAYVSRRSPRPGIDARQFDEDILEMESPRTEKVVLDSIAKAFVK